MISISVTQQRILIGFNPVFLEYDAIGEKLADLGYVVRPCGQTASSGIQRKNAFSM